MVKHIITKQDSNKFEVIELTAHDHMYFNSYIDDNGYVKTYVYVIINGVDYWYTWLKPNLPLIDHIWIDGNEFWK